MASDTAVYESMTARELVAAYLSYRLTARSSTGSDGNHDRYQSLILEEVARKRGLLPLLVEAFQAMKASGWTALPAEVAKTVCEETAS